MGHLNNRQVVNTKQAYFLKEENNGDSTLFGALTYSVGGPLPPQNGTQWGGRRREM
jgi:hypothetical protein